MRSHILFALLGASQVALACDDHDHSTPHDHRGLHKRLPPSAPLTPPSTPLIWGDVNIIHTTDSHGWLLGHQKPSFPEPNYSADFGDFASFVMHMKALAEEKDVDLLLVDTGDLHDGTGLSDGFPPGGVDGQQSTQLFATLPYDVLTLGNHELGVYNITKDMHDNFAPRFPGRYLSSNANITINNVSEPVGERFAKFTTSKGRKVTALGVIYHFTGDEGTTIQEIPSMVNETWFAEAIEEEPDFFLLTGHMPVNGNDWLDVFNAVRVVHPNTPILVLGGHTHIRDCAQYDGRSMALESGRYMETVGWMSANLTDNGNISFSRRYMDSNRVTFEYHSGQSNDTFDTDNGTSLTASLLDLANQFDLSFLYGMAPQDYPFARAPYPSNSSLLSLLADEVLPLSLSVNNTRASSIPAYIIVQTGGLRFDIFKGSFTKNDQLTVLPRTNVFLYIANITLSQGQKVLAGLNGDASVARRDLVKDSAEEEYEARYHEWIRDMAQAHFAKRDVAEDLTLGYVTEDSCPGVGDDTPHTAVQDFTSTFPDYVPSPAPDVADADAPILDFVFPDFIQDDVIDVLNSIQSDKVYDEADVLSYSPLELKDVLGVYAQMAWN
ncbi:hypothetical protein PENSPDRAFT_760009 [Peniophora sp. CONT]|nr:hypothetical protein PENSPDRAFT_760009 [Peniophora sp. CONT]